MHASYQILLIHSLFTWILIGMIWLIQIVYYPLSKALGTLYQKYEHDQLRYLGFFTYSHIHGGSRNGNCLGLC